MIKCLGGMLSLWIITYNLQKYIDVETVTLLTDLRKLLNTKEKKVLHNYLLHPKELNPIINPYARQKERTMKKHSYPTEDYRILESNIEWYDYLGSLELGVIMLEKGLIDKKEFDNQFGYRLDNIYNKEAIRKHVYDAENNYEFLKKYFQCNKDNYSRQS